MSVVVTILALVVVLTAMGLAVFAIVTLARGRREDHDLLLNTLAWAQNSTEYAHRVALSRSAGEMAHLERVNHEVDVAAVRSQARERAGANSFAGGEVLIDPDTGEVMAPIGMA